MGGERGGRKKQRERTRLVYTIWQPKNLNLASISNDTDCACESGAVVPSVELVPHSVLFIELQ